MPVLVVAATSSSCSTLSSSPCTAVCLGPGEGSQRHLWSGAAKDCSTSIQQCWRVLVDLNVVWGCQPAFTHCAQTSLGRTRGSYSLTSSQAVLCFLTDILVSPVTCPVESGFPAAGLWIVSEVRIASLGTWRVVWLDMVQYPSLCWVSRQKSSNVG